MIAGCDRAARAPGRSALARLHARLISLSSAGATVRDVDALSSPALCRLTAWALVAFALVTGVTAAP